MRRYVLIAVVIALGLTWAVPAAAPAQEGEARPHRLRVGTRVAPPFSMRTTEGEWEGLSLELWRALADRLDLDFSLEERSLQELLDAVASGELDAAVAALTVTPDRERRLDFTHPFYSTGLAIAVAPETGGRGWLRVVERVVSPDFLLVVGLLLVLLLLAGALVWLFEGRRNREMFGGGPAGGLGSGFWWAAVTMTTVGYGDKAPKTIGGRIVALIWMFASIIVISSFTAAIAASLTVGELSDKVAGLADLPQVRVGAVADSSSAEFLARRGIGLRPFPAAEDGLRAIVDGELDAFVHDQPLLSYLARVDYPGRIVVLPETFDRQDYAIALPPGSPLREPLNRELLSSIHSDDWQRRVERHLGPGR